MGQQTFRFFCFFLSVLLFSHISFLVLPPYTQLRSVTTKQTLLSPPHYGTRFFFVSAGIFQLFLRLSTRIEFCQLTLLGAPSSPNIAGTQLVFCNVVRCSLLQGHAIVHRVKPAFFRSLVFFFSGHFFFFEFSGWEPRIFLVQPLP